MAFKSEAHKKKLYELHAAGKVSLAEMIKHEMETYGKRLPKRLRPKDDRGPAKPSDDKGGPK